MSNIYRYQFSCICPADGAVIAYELEIESDQMIRAEQIVAEVGAYQSEYHEIIADGLHARFGGKQTLFAQHHGVDIETRRGFEEPDYGRLTKRVIVGSTVYEKGVEAKLAIAAVSR